MNPDGSEQVRLTQHLGNDLQAVWAPTGEKILFISDRGGRARPLPDGPRWNQRSTRLQEKNENL